jgi:hypothetical protein
MAVMFVNGSGQSEQSPQAILVSDWLISKKSSSLKPLCQMNQNLVGNIPGRSSIKNKGQSRMCNTDPTKQTRGSALTFHSALWKLNTEPYIGASRHFWNNLHQVRSMPTDWKAK